MNQRNCRKGALLLLTAGLVLFAGCSTNNTPSTSSLANGSSSASMALVPTTSSAVSGSSTVNSAKPSSAGNVAQTVEAPHSILDDAVFIGDSVSLKLKNYVTIKRKTNASFFGKAQFLTAGSMGSGNALKPLSETSIHPSYNGKKALLEDSVAQIGAKKIYIMFGINDIAVYGVDGSVQNMMKLLERIKAKSPNATVIVQSATPMVKEKQMTQLNNKTIKSYNDGLKKACMDKGYPFLDVASVLTDSDGNLPKQYCSDPNILGIHFTDKACEIWINYILTHTVK